MWRGCGTKSCGKGIQDGFSCNCKSTWMRAWRTPSFESGKLRQLPVVWGPDWRGSIVPKQPLSLAAYFLSVSIVFLSQGFSGKHRKSPQTRTKIPQINAVTPGTGIDQLYSPSFFLLCLHPTLGWLQSLPRARGHPKASCKQDRTVAARKLLQMTAVASQQYKKYDRDGSVCGRLEGATNCVSPSPFLFQCTNACSCITTSCWANVVAGACAAKFLLCS